MRRLWVVAVLALAVSPGASAAEPSYRHGRIRHVEEGVSIQRATETGSEEATPNLPFLPGDRVWTDGGGRVEFQFARGSVVRLDRASKLDYVAHEDDRIVLRLWSGALYVHADARDEGLEFETPAGVIASGGRAVLRLDVESGEARLSVYEGDATLEAREPVHVRAGERVYARQNEIEEGPAAFDRAEGDEFAEWDGAREEQTAYAANHPRPLPEDIAPYAGELDRYGSWYYETEVGNVWRPYVGTGWQPYSSGRWVWTVFGWTWVPAESWGWATSHYGRWGFAPALGWYWIPGATWGPAWVSWAVGGDYVGWCPLGYRDRPVLVYDHFGRGHQNGGGFAIPRGVATVASPWLYVRRGDVGARDLARRRIHLDSSAFQQVKVLDNPHARLTRNLAVTEAPPPVARAVPRSVSRRPEMSDTVPEMRADPMTTIPVARRRGRGAETGGEREPIEGTVSGTPSDRGLRYGGGAFGASDGTRPTAAATPPPAATPRSHPTDVRSGQRGVETPSDAPARHGQSGDASADHPARPRDGASDADREVLRPMFRPLGRPRGGDGSDGDHRRPVSSDGDGRGSGAAHRDGSEGRHGGAEAHPAGTSREREPAPRAQGTPPPHNESQAQPRRERESGAPAAGGGARRRHGDQ